MILAIIEALDAQASCTGGTCPKPNVIAQFKPTEKSGPESWKGLTDSWKGFRDKDAAAGAECMKVVASMPARAAKPKAVVAMAEPAKPTAPAKVAEAPKPVPAVQPAAETTIAAKDRDIAELRIQLAAAREETARAIGTIKEKDDQLKSLSDELKPLKEAARTNAKTAATPAAMPVATPAPDETAKQASRNVATVPVRTPCRADRRDTVLLFRKDSDRVDAGRSLTRALSALRACPGVKVVVNGYADADGTTAHNKALSRRRAEHVASELKKAGVPAERISTVAHGERAGNGPKSDDRRVEIVIR